MAQPNVTAPIFLGDQSVAVTNLQAALATLGFSVSSEEAAIGFGSETCNAVNNFKIFSNFCRRGIVPVEP